MRCSSDFWSTCIVYIYGIFNIKIDINMDGNIVGPRVASSVARPRLSTCLRIQYVLWSGFLCPLTLLTILARPVLVRRLGQYHDHSVKADGSH